MSIGAVDSSIHITLGASSGIDTSYPNWWALKDVGEIRMARRVAYSASSSYGSINRVIVDSGTNFIVLPKQAI
jgi:hypothetical protein